MDNENNSQFILKKALTNRMDSCMIMTQDLTRACLKKKNMKVF